MLKNLTIYVLLFSSLLFISACGENSDAQSSSTENENDKSLTLLFSFPSSSLDPHQDSIVVRSGIAETLVKLDDNLEVSPWLAESWEQTDEKNWEFIIQEGITFHDGTVVDAEAVRNSFERAIEINDSLNAILHIQSIEADGQKLTFTTEDEYPSFLSELINPNTAVIKHDSEDISMNPIGTGPFLVDSFEPDTKISLNKFEEYWDGPAKIDHAEILFNTDANVRSLSLQSNEVDIAYHLSAEGLDEIENSKEHRIASVPSLRSHFLLYNSASKELQNAKVRQAIDLIINRPVMTEEIMNGHAMEANGPFHPNFSFASETATTTYDPEEAITLLKEAGYEQNSTGEMEKDGETLSLNLATYESRPELPLMAQYLQAEAKSIGIDLSISSVEAIDSYLVDQQDDWDMVTYSNITAPRGDAGYFLNVAYLPGGSLNHGQINISTLNDTIETLNHTVDEKDRDALAKQALEIIQDEVPQSFILHPHIIVGINERVKNWEPGAEEYYFLTNEMDVE